MTNDLANLSLHQPYHGDDAVLIGDGSGLSITHTGSLSLPSSSHPLTLDKTLCVPNIQKNLISVYRLCNTNQVSVEFFPAHFQVKDLNSGVPLLHGKTRDELYEWPISPKAVQTFFTSASPKTTLYEWHYRLGHPSLSILKNIISKFSLPFSQSPTSTQLCTDCAINKSHKLPFSQTSIVSTRPLQYIFTDVWTSPILSFDNFKYYLVLVDHYTRYTWIYPLKTKSQVKEIFLPFKALVENHFHTKIGTLYSDNGGEFIALRLLLASAGITHLTSPPHTLEHNGVSERKHRHIVETGLSLLTHAGMPKTYWTYAFATAVYLINRQPSPTISMESPFQKLFGTTPNYSKMRIFGSLCFPWLRPYTTHKLQDRSAACVFLGYSPTQSAYLCLQPNSGRLYVSRHVQFDEQVFPFQTLTQSPPTTEESPANSSPPAIRLPLTAPPPPLVSPSPSLPPPSPGPSPPIPHQTMTQGTNSTSVTRDADISDEDTSSSISSHPQNNQAQPSPNYSPQAHTNPSPSPNLSPSTTETQSSTQSPTIPTPPQNPSPSPPPSPEPAPPPNANPTQK
ncbi:unnamed protein product [Microthlaspi erraticum]|uniref:Integrase catalytic domain-containing protein n=1 Tax=Microthlaspi erraticum TaxID=1685480 RepID=A0A6D2HXK0_9BRAS|nr:unnamed protein product [Microthlaspi erraticum]